MVYLGTNRLNDRWLGTTLLGDKKVFPGLLDTYPATAAYSAGRRLKSDQTYAMRIRRESDNAELDIGFDANGDTDVAAIEEFSGYNLLGYTTGDYSESAWLNNDIILSAAIDNFTKLVANNNNSDHKITQIVPVLFSETYTISAEFKAEESNTILLWKSNPAGGVFVNIQTGQYLGSIQTTPDNIEIIEVETGVFKVSFRFSNPTSEQSSFRVYLCENNSTNFNFVGNNIDGLLVRNLQFERGAVVSSYQEREAGGASDCFVPTLYDATGNGNDATQSVAINQPKIYDVATTSVITENGKPALEFDGVNTDLEFPNIAGNSYLDAWFVSRHDGTNSDRFLYPFSPTPPNTWGFGFVVDKDSLEPTLRYYGSPEFYVNGVLSPQSTRDETYSAMGDSYRLIEHRAADVSTWYEFHVGWYLSGGGYDFEGTFQEILLFTDGSNPTNRTAIENNINNYYEIY